MTVGVVGLVLSVALFQGMWTREQQAARADFDLEAQEVAQAIRRRVQRNFESVRALAGHFEGSRQVSWQEFQLFADRLLAHYPEVNSLQWLPRVAADEREAHEQTPLPEDAYLAQVDDGDATVRSGRATPDIEDYQVYELVGDNERMPAAERDEYYPIYYLAPWRRNHFLWGLDLGATSLGQPAMNEAMRSGELAATVPVQGSLVWVFNHVHRPVPAYDERIAALDGFVAGAFRIDAVVDGALPWYWESGENVGIGLWDVTAPDDIHPVYASSVADSAGDAFTYDDTIELGRRQWRVVVTPSAAYIDDRRTLSPPGLLLGGFIVTGLVTALLASVMARAERAHLEAADRAVRARQQTVVAELGLVALRETVLQALMDRAANAVAETLAVELVEVLEWSGDEESLRLRAGVGWKPGLVGQATIDAAKQSHAGYTLLCDEPVVVDDLMKETRFKGSAMLHEHGGVSGLSAIIHEEGRRYGVLGAHATRHRQFSDNDIAFLQAVASVLGQAIVQSRRAAELRESEERFRTMADAAPALIWMSDIDKRRNYFNRQWLEFTGRSMQEELGAGWLEGVYEDDRARCGQAYDDAFERRIGFRMHYRLRRADGEYRWLLDEGTPRFTAAGGFAGYIGACIDVTDQKRAAEQLETMNEQLEQRVAARTEALRRSNLELEQFAYIASHDLQEPLRKVEGFGDMLADHLGAALDGEARDYLQRMYAAVQRMRSLIDGLLTYSRVTTKATAFEVVDLNEVVRGVMSDLELRIRETDGKVRVQELPTLNADPLQMRQLFQNLIGNGLKFHRPDQRPRVEVFAETNGRAESDGQPPQPGCRLFVRDHGIGIESKYESRIFVPFQRLHGRDSPYQGTGIGLAVCRKIADRHGGTIRVENTPGGGATFVVTLPCRSLQQTTEATTP
ncbi:MAG: CHASE domain-containing protein [Phycisphaeraceae bacterium]